VDISDVDQLKATRDAFEAKGIDSTLGESYGS